MAILITSSWFFNEVIILDLYLLVIFTPYYDPWPPLWNMMVNIMYSCWWYFPYHKGCISIAVRTLLYALTYPRWFTRFPVVHLVNQVPRGLPDLYTRAEVLI